MVVQRLGDVAPEEPAKTPPRSKSPRPTTPATSYDPARLLKVSWPKDGERPTERELRASFEQIAPVTNVGLGGGNAALVVFADADGMNKARSSYEGPLRVAPARSASPRPPMPPLGREVAVHNSAPVENDADLVKKHRRRAAKARAAADAAPVRADAEAERARALHDELGRQARSDEAARLRAVEAPRPSPVYERVASKLSATRRDQDAALEKEAAMWRERALRAEAAMSKPPESPQVETMFQKHAASLREEVKATIEAALKEDRPAATPARDDRPAPIAVQEEAPPSPPSLEGADDAPPAPLSPWRQAAQEAREDLAVSTEKTSEADDAFARLMAKQHALAAKLEGDLERIREGMDEFQPATSTSRALVPQTFDLLPARPPPPIYSYARPSSIRHLEPAFRPTNPALREWWAGVTRSSRAY